MGLPMWLSGKELSCQCRRTRFDLRVRKIHWRRKWQMHSNIFAWEIPWARKPSHRVAKSWTQFSDWACMHTLLYSMLNEKQNVFFTYTLHIVIYTKWAEGWYDGMKIFDNTHEYRLMLYYQSTAKFSCFFDSLLLLLSRFSRVRLCDPIDGSPAGSPVPGILQARTLERVAISSFNAWKWKVKVKSLSRVWLLATPCTI